MHEVEAACLLLVRHGEGLEETQYRQNRSHAAAVACRTLNIVSSPRRRADHPTYLVERRLRPTARLSFLLSRVPTPQPHYLLFSSVAFGESILVFEGYSPRAASPVFVGRDISDRKWEIHPSTKALILELDGREGGHLPWREWPSQFTRLPSFSRSSNADRDYAAPPPSSRAERVSFPLMTHLSQTSIHRSDPRTALPLCTT